MRSHSAQKAGLTRAVRKAAAATASAGKTMEPGWPNRSGAGYEIVREECSRAVREWNGSYWPDDWSAWQRALDDSHPAFRCDEQLEDLA